MATRAAKREPTKRPRERLLTGARRAQLIAMGLEAFGARSYDEVSIDDLARAAGISKGLLYHYFRTKRAFYVAAVTEAARRLLEETATDATLPPLERAVRGLSAYLTFVERHGTAYVTLMRGGVGFDAEVMRVVEGTRAKLIERVLEARGAEDPATRLAIRGWIGFVEATSLEWVERRAMDRDELVGLWVRVLGGLLS
ncbi:MAG TPA: helix-turn-helix domain-containing protein [Polyangiaceae bacterium]